MKTFLLAFSLAIFLLNPGRAASQTIPDQFNQTLEGKIGGKYDIEMEVSRKGGQLTGSYFYIRPGARLQATSLIALSGRVERDGMVRLDEQAEGPDGAARKTGEFRGRFVTGTIAGELVITFDGQWTRNRDRQSLSFLLRTRRADLGSTRLRKVRREEKSAGQEIVLNLPELSNGDGTPDQSFDRHVASTIAPVIAEFNSNSKEIAGLEKQNRAPNDPLPLHSLEIDYLVKSANPSTLSLLLTIYSFLGGAHPSSTSLSINWNLRKGQPLELADIFATGRDPLTVISTYCRAELKRIDSTDPASIDAMAGPKIENYQSWNILPQGLLVTFDAGKIGPRAAGPIEVLVPFRLLSRR